MIFQADTPFTPNFNSVLAVVGIGVLGYMAKLLLHIRGAVFGGDDGKKGITEILRVLAVRMDAHCKDELQWHDDRRADLLTTRDHAQVAISEAESRLTGRMDQLDQSVGDLARQVTALTERRRKPRL